MPAIWEHDDGQQLLSKPQQVSPGSCFRWLSEVPRTNSTAASLRSHPDPQPTADIPQPHDAGLWRCISRLQRPHSAAASRHGPREGRGAPVWSHLCPRLGRAAEKPPSFTESRQRRARPRQDAGKFWKLLSQSLHCASERRCVTHNWWWRAVCVCVYVDPK